LRFCATKPGKAARGLALNISLQRFTDDGRLLLNAGIFLRLREKFVIYRNGGFHRYAPSASNIASFDATFHVLRIALESHCNCG
jgi:hypothetical protein